MEKKIPEWRKLIDENDKWVGMERTQFLSIEEAKKQGYIPPIKR